MPAHHLSFGREGAARVEALEPFGARVLSPSQRRKTPSGVRNRRLVPALPTFGSAAPGHAEPTVNRKRVRGRAESLRRHDNASWKGAYCAGPRESPPGAPPRRRTFGSQSATRHPTVPDREKRPSGHGLRDSISGASTERRFGRQTAKECPLGRQTTGRNPRVPDREKASRHQPKKRTLGFRTAGGASEHPEAARRPRVSIHGKTSSDARPRKDPTGLRKRSEPSGSGRQTDSTGVRPQNGPSGAGSQREPSGTHREKASTGIRPREGTFGFRTARRRPPVSD
jgi:hypothetical protein